MIRTAIPTLITVVDVADESPLVVSSSDGLELGAPVGGSVVFVVGEGVKPHPQAPLIRY